MTPREREEAVTAGRYPAQSEVTRLAQLELVGPGGVLPVRVVAVSEEELEALEARVQREGKISP